MPTAGDLRSDLATQQFGLTRDVSRALETNDAQLSEFVEKGRLQPDLLLKYTHEPRIKQIRVLRRTPSLDVNSTKQPFRGDSFVMGAASRRISESQHQRKVTETIDLTSSPRVVVLSTSEHVIEHSKPDVTLMDRNQSLARTRSLTNLTSDLQERVSDRSSYVATARNGKTAEAKCTPKKGRRGSISTLLSAQEWSNLTEGVRTKTKRYEEEQAGRLLIKLVMPA